MYHFINLSKKEKKNQKKKKKKLSSDTSTTDYISDNKITWSSKLTCKDLDTFLALDYNSRDILISRL